VSIGVKFGTHGATVIRKSVRLGANIGMTFGMVTAVVVHDANIVEKSGMLVASFVESGVMQGRITETVHFAEQAGGTTTIEMVAVIIEHTAVIIK